MSGISSYRHVHGVHESCGTPVLASNNSSIPEVVGDAAVLFDALNYNEIKNRIEETIDDSRKKNELISKGFTRCRLFSWTDTVETVKKEIKRVLDE